MSRRLRVLFYIGTMHAGGAERQVVELIKHLDRNQFEPVLGLATKQGALLAEIPPDVPVHAFQMSESQGRRFGMGRLFRWKFLSRLLQHERIDVVYDRTFLATLDIGPATWVRKTPRISAVVADPRIQMDLYFPKRQFLWKRFAKRVYRSANLVLANSEGLRQQVLDYFQLPADQVRVLRNVLDTDRLDRMASERIDVDDAARFRLLTVGRIDQHKGHGDLLEAVRRLVHDHGQNEILWQIIGDGPTRVSLMEEVQRKNLINHVQWLGIQTNPYPYYRAANLFCLPSLTEGSPNVLLEALALGTPVISTDCPSGPRELLEQGRWGYLVPMQNPSALVEAILDRIVHPEAWLARATQAKPVIREQYAPALGVKHLEDLLREAAGKSASQSEPLA